MPLAHAARGISIPIQAPRQSIKNDATRSQHCWQKMSVEQAHGMTRESSGSALKVLYRLSPHYFFGILPPYYLLA